MGQRFEGGYGEDERFPEQYGGRARSGERGWARSRRRAEDEWDRPQRFESSRYGGEDDLRFGNRRSRRDLERDDSELGRYAGRGYEEPDWGRGGEWPRFGPFEGESRGRGERHPRHLGGYGDAHGGYERGGYDRGEEPGESAWYGGFEGGRVGEYSPGPGPGYGSSGAFPGRGRGGFSGRGPKDYRRSDERIREDVCDRLTADPDIDPSEIAVVVNECEVTLEGTVEDRWAKRHAEDVAESVAGVRQVHNRLHIGNGQGARSGPGARFGNATTGRM